MHKNTVGIIAEKVAADFLAGKGYHILDQNWARKWGELDIVAEKSGTVIFCEVKASSKSSAGFNPEIRADWSKMTKVARTARTWLAYRKYPSEQAWQIDILSVTFEKESRSAHIKHFKNVEF